MKKISKLIFVSSEKIKGHWWHRLSNVLIYGSTIVVGILIFCTVVLGLSYKMKTYTAYSFQSNYASAQGQELACRFSPNFFQVPFDSNSDLALIPNIQCGDIDDSSGLLSLLEQNQTWSDKLYCLRASDHGCLGLRSDNQVVNYLIKNNSLNGITVKKLDTILYAQLFQNIGFFLLLTFLWFVFWESIVYRAIIYIAFGKK